MRNPLSSVFDKLGVSKLRTLSGVTTDVTLEGVRPNGFVKPIDEQLEALLFGGSCVSLQIGETCLDATFTVARSVLLIDIAHIEGKPRDAVNALAIYTLRFAMKKQLEAVEYTIRCSLGDIDAFERDDRFTRSHSAGMGVCYRQRVELVRH